MDESPLPGRREDGRSDEPSGDADEREVRLAELRAAVQSSLDDIKAGRVADPEAALDGVEAMLDELEAAKRA